MQRNHEVSQDQRRNFIKKVGYTAPVIMTLAAAPTLAQTGSSGGSGGGGNPDCPDQPVGEDCS